MGLKKIGKGIGAIAAGLLAVGLLASPATASTAGISETPDSSTTQGDDQLKAELMQLAESQTHEEVQELIDTGAPLELLWDIETNEYTAARLAETPVSTQAIGTKCFNNAAVLYQMVGDRQSGRCFDGTGDLNGSWPRAVKHYAGTYGTSIWYSTGSGNSAVYAAPGATVVYSGEIHAIAISRS